MRPPFIGDEAHVAPVTLVVAVHDDASHLPALLAAIERQEVAPAELLVADRGSTDGTTQLLGDWSPPALLSFKVIEAAGTTVAEARNLAIESAAYETILVTEAGVQPQPEWISRLWGAICSGTAAASGRIRPDGSDALERAIALLRIPAAQHCRYSAASSVNLAFTRDAWDEVGGYPEWLEAGQDEVFVAALREAGTAVVDVPDAVVSWSPGQRLGGFALGSFRTGQALGQAGIVRTPGAAEVATAGALLVCAFVRRAFGAVVAGAIVVRSGATVRSVWQSRADSADPIGVRIVLTIGARLLGDVTTAAGYVVGRFAALRGIDPVKVRSERRKSAALYRSDAVSLAAMAVQSVPLLFGAALHAAI